MGERTDRHAFGTSLGCLGQRHFVMWAYLALAILSAFQLVCIISGSSFVYLLVHGESEGGQAAGCVGTECYEVWSCWGMRETTEHIIMPFMALTGVMFFPLGFWGALHCIRWEVRYAALYTFLAGLVYLGCMAFDLIYSGTCSAYTTNIVHTTLTQSFPPSPLTTGAKEMLLDMSTYPKQEVEDITNGFQVLLWYCCVMGSITAVILYLAGEAYGLAMLIDRGPLGLGINYGLDQWDEAINNDAVRRQKEREMKSKFIEDATTPLVGYPGDLRASYGYQAHTMFSGVKAYGSTVPQHVEHLPQGDRLETFQEDVVLEASIVKPVEEAHGPAKLEGVTADQIKAEEQRQFMEEAARFKESLATMAMEDHQYMREEAANQITADWTSDYAASEDLGEVSKL